jgi:hypothetical protein
MLKKETQTKAREEWDAFFADYHNKEVESAE